LTCLLGVIIGHYRMNPFLKSDLDDPVIAVVAFHLFNRGSDAIADLTLRASEAQGGFVRLNAATAFAMARQFDEAERLANEAVAVGQAMRPPRTDLFARQAEQIRRMKAAAESGVPTAVPGVTVIPTGGSVTGGAWFTTTTPVGATGPRQ
jgi:hypothetical protein